MKCLVSAILITLFIGFPTYIASTKPDSFNILAQVLFSIMLTAASIFFGYFISSENEKRRATAKWLPAAESACNKLLTISANSELMMDVQKNACDGFENIFPNVPTDNLSQLKSFIEGQCARNLDDLQKLKNQIDDSYRDWNVFIEANCEQSECKVIKDRLQQRKSELKGEPESNMVCSDIVHH